MPCTSCSKNATVFFVFLVNLCSGKAVCHHRYQVCFQTCDFTTITDTVHYSPAAVTSCVFVRHLRWTWFEFSWLCFFPVTIPTSTCMRCLGLVCGFVVWWGGITICLNTWMDFTSTFMMLDVSYTVCVSEQDREICSFTSGAYCSLLGVPPEVFALMQ